MKNFKKIKYKHILPFLIVLTCFCHGNSKNYFKKSSEFFLEKRKDSTLYKLYKNSDSLYKNKKISKALKFALQVIDASKRDENLELISNTHFLIGKILYASGDYEKAILNFEKSVLGFSKALEKKKRIEDSKYTDTSKYNFQILDGNLQIGNSYLKMYEFSDDTEKDSINKTYRKKALKYYKKVLENETVSDSTLLLKSKAYNNLSGIYLRDSAYIKAEEYALKSIEIKKRTEDKFSLAKAYNALSNIYFFKEEYEASKKVLSLGLESIKNIKGKKVDEIRVVLYMNMAYSMYKLKDYLAYDYQEKSWQLYYKIRDRENEQKIADIYADRNFNKGLQEGIFMREIERQRAQRNFWIICISSFFIIVLLIFYLNHYKLQQKNLKLKLSQIKLIQNQKIEKLRSESQIRVLNATIDGRETERKEIAEILHDNVSALLSSANLHLQAYKAKGKSFFEIKKTIEIITEASHKIRNLSHTLVSSVLLKFGLKFAITHMAEKHSNSQIKIIPKTGTIRRYNQQFEVKTHNIILECVNNVLKHSNASEAVVQVDEVEGTLCLQISDNGKGFDKTKIEEKDGLGINQINARVHIMKGEFYIDSEINKGTSIQIKLPVLEK